MKNIITKFMSFFLIVTLLVSSFAVLSYAVDDEEQGTDEEDLINIDENIQVHFNRTFDEGWDLSNGLLLNPVNNLLGIENETWTDGTVNNYAYIESLNDDSFFFNLGYDKSPEIGGVFEFDVKVDDYYNCGNVIYTRSPGGLSNGVLLKLLDVENNVLRIMGNTYSIGEINEKWLHIAYVMDMDQTNYLCTSCKHVNDLDENFTVHANDGVDCEECGAALIVHMVAFKVYFGFTDTFDPEGAVDATALGAVKKDLTVTHYMEYNFGVGDTGNPKSWLASSLEFFRFGPGIYSSRKDVAGQKIKFDNIKLYSYLTDTNEDGSKREISINSLEGYGYGTLVDSEMQKTISTGGSGASTGTDKLKEGIMLKTGSDYMSHKGERYAIYTDEATGLPYGSPVKIDGVVYVPFEPLLEMTGYPYLWHKDGVTCDISTESGSSLLTMGRSTAIINGAIVDLVGAPRFIEADRVEGTVYPVMAMDDIEKFFPGYYVSYDNMGLIGICQAEDVFDRDTNLYGLLDYMKSFIFDYLSGEEFYDRVKENTNNFDHPYMMVDQEKFDMMNKVYTGEIKDEMYLKILTSHVESAEKLYQRYTTRPAKPAVTATVNYGEKNPEYELLYFELTNYRICGIEDGQWYTDLTYDYGQYPCLKDGLAVQPAGYIGKDFNDGCDISGRTEAERTMAENIHTLALAYQITRNENYAKLAWEMSVSLSKWASWGHQQFLICGEVSGYMGRVYDWLYDIWTEFNYDTNLVAQNIYAKTVYYGYIVTIGKSNSTWFDDNSKQPGTTNYHQMEINWNAVCSGGLINGMLAIIGAQDPEGNDVKVGTDYKGKAYTQIDFTFTNGHFKNSENLLYFLISQNFKDFTSKGINQYAPDGSFIESPGYWDYATNNFAYLIWAVDTAVGDDLGLMDAWAVHETFYFAVYCEYSNSKSDVGYYYWNYHDSGNGIQETIMFYPVATWFDDSSLAAIRTDHIKCGRSVYWSDVLGYEIGYGDLKMDEVELSNDYYGEVLHCLFSRESWEKGAMFVGFMGHMNDATAHGQMDAGNIFYANKGHNWIIDMGTEHYDVYGLFGGSSRYGYYRNNPEGANTLLLLDVQEQIPYGQNSTGGGVFMVDEYSSEEYGSKAILDMSSAFTPFVTEAYRGVLYTNSRSTVVVQDQVTFTGMREFAWVAHTFDNASVSNDGRQLYMSASLEDGLTHMVRLSIVSDDARLKFEVIDAGVSTFLLKATHRWGYSPSFNMREQNGRDAFKRIMIRSTGMKLNLAVVVEYLDPITGSAEDPIKYEYTDMFNWKISDGSEYEGLGSGGSGSSEEIGTAELKHIAEYTNAALKLVSSNYAFTSRTSDFFKNLARVNNAINTYRPETLPDALKTKYQEYLECLNKYNLYKERINSKIGTDVSVMIGLTTGSGA